LHLKQTIGSVEMFAQAQFSTQETEKRLTGEVISIDVPNTNPFFVDPTGTGLTTVTVENYSFQTDFVSRDFGEVDSVGGVLGARVDLADSWFGELVVNWSKENATAGGHLRLDPVALDLAVASNDSATAFNPFGDGPTDPAVLESFMDRSRRVENDSQNELLSVSLNIEGEVFDVAGGGVRVSTGIELREDSLFSLSEPAEGGIPFDLSRDVSAVYAELLFPLVSGLNSRPALRRLEVSLAARYEDYSDFGDTTNPKFGIVWSPIEALILRGTYGTSFRAPALFDLDVSNLNSNAIAYIPQSFADSGLVPFPLLFRIGGNEDLLPEEAVTWTAGFEWTAASVKGLSLDMTYFNVDFEDRIDLPGQDFFAATFDPRFAQLLNTNPTPDQIADLATDPRYVDAFIVTTPSADLLSGSAPVEAIFDFRINNLSQTVVTGLELQLTYDFETAVGSFNLGLNGSYLFDFERKFLRADPLIDEVDIYGRPIDFRARGAVTWSSDHWSVSGFVNYADGYTDNINDDPARSVESWTTVDLSVAYGAGEVSGFLSGTRLSLNTQNLFDEGPPFVNTLFGLGYDSANANPLGMLVSFQVTKDW
jgi:iron complex outermembrane receptor protein